MKGKFRSMWRVGIALVLVLSLSLVMAAPVPAASPADTDVGFEFSIKDGNDTVLWDAVPETALPAGGLGNYSVELMRVDGDQPIYVEFIPAAGTTLSDLEALTNDWSFWYHLAEVGGPIGNPAGPQLELRFTSGTDYVDITIMAAQATYATENAWEEVVLADDLGKVFYWSPTVIEGAEVATLALAMTALSADDDFDVLGDWELTRVRAELYEASPPRNCHIDDITIDGTTYELEPIFLDAEYYSVGDTVEVTVPNFKANTDSIRINPVTGDDADGVDVTDWKVTVISTSDEVGITVDLEETGINTGVFTGSFSTTSTTPAEEDELYVQDDDDITVTYDETGDWGSGDQSADLTLTASVDDTAPTITVASPVDGEQIIETLPTIEATYIDDPDVSGIDEDSVEMFFDGVDVTEDAVADGDNVTYTPEDDLVDGNYDVTVNVSDNAGNMATESWSFRVVSWLVDPMDGEDEDALVTVGVAVFSVDADAADIMVGRFASNPEPGTPPTFPMIENGFFDVQVVDADDATEIVLIFADDSITAESTAYVWGELQGEWLECSDQGYSVANEWLWVKVRTNTIPTIAELTGTPFAISGEPAVDILAYYRGYSGDAEVVETTDLLKAGNDWANAVVPPDFTEPISTTQLLTLANEWAATG